MAPDDLRTLFQRVVPPAPVRPQGGGHRRRGDREVLAAIIFVATSGCTWNPLPPGFGLSGVTAFRWFTEWTEARVWAKLHRLVRGIPPIRSRRGPRHRWVVERTVSWLSGCRRLHRRYEREPEHIVCSQLRFGPSAPLLVSSRPEECHVD
jgi:transposase